MDKDCSFYCPTGTLDGLTTPKQERIPDEVVQEIKRMQQKCRADPKASRSDEVWAFILWMAQETPYVGVMYSEHIKELEKSNV